RRRHTMFSRDWSSDVCSSDLGKNFNPWSVFRFSKYGSEYDPNYENSFVRFLPDVLQTFNIPVDIDIMKELERTGYTGIVDSIIEIGRASCRERVEERVGTV